MRLLPPVPSLVSHPSPTPGGECIINLVKGPCLLQSSAQAWLLPWEPQSLGQLGDTSLSALDWKLPGLFIHCASPAQILAL